MTRTDYEAGAKAYARHRLPNPEVLAALAQGGAVDGQSRVLEVGCDTGNHIIALARISPARPTAWNQQTKCALLPSRAMMR